MRTILIIAILFTASLLKAQEFELSTSTAQGVIINRNYDTDQFTATIEVRPSLVVGKWKVSAVTQSFTTSNRTGFLAGTQAGYKILDNYYLNARALYGNTGTELYGGGLEADFGAVIVNGDIGYEKKDVALWLSLGIGYKIIQ